MRSRLGLGALIACVALSCASIIGIDDRLPEEATGPDGGTEASVTTEDGAVPDSPIGTPDGGPLTYGVGDGHSGALNVTTNVTVNSNAPIAAAAAGASKVSYTGLRGPAFANGDLVLVWQSAASAAPASNGPTIDPAAANVGQWEVARVTSVAASDDAGTGGELTLDHALAHAYAATGAQVVRVPEYTDVTIAANQNIGAQNWDGASGGIVAFYVKGTLTNNGSVNATGSGFRGGVGVVTGVGLGGCTAANGVPTSGFAHKGEGIFPGAYGDAGGLGNATIGGGGGDCYNAGGGGGGNGGAGGQGGQSGDGDGSRDVGGRGGAAFAAVSVLERLLMGGGGGAGEEDNGLKLNGGNGGGVVLVRAQEIALPGGRFAARGQGPGGKADSSGAPGGGAGGTVLVQAAGTLGCQLLSVLGGPGGSIDTLNANNGPGGGGGGGRAFMQGGTTACSVEVKAGTAGRDLATTGTKGATPAINAESSPPFVGAAQLVSDAYCASCP